VPRSPGLHSCLSPMHTASGARPRGPARRVADRRDAISCAAASASAGYGRKRRLTPLGRSSTIYRQCLEAAHLGDPISPRYRSARRKTTTTLPQRGGTSGTVPVELPYPSALSQRSARLSSGQSGRMAQHPVVQARRPSPRVLYREHAPTHRSEGSATTPQCRPARVRPFADLIASARTSSPCTPSPRGEHQHAYAAAFTALSATPPDQAK
jgi:hypothetical protein